MFKPSYFSMYVDILPSFSISTNNDMHVVQIDLGLNFILSTL